ncbi:MAG: flagellar basal body rod protein FlgB [Thermoleophilaceae bacterium]|nr:flagellar basal body rod protein FlgB [Thermoleophilaceae bacterium]
MNLFDTTQVGLEKALEGAALRQQALAGNLANVNTPGYQRRDVDFHGALRAAFEDGADPQAASFSVQTDPTAAMRADGNSVDPDVEAARLAENALEYQALVSVMRGRIDILEAAMGRG